MFEKQVEQIESLYNDEEFFEREVLKLNDMYDIPDFGTVHDFLCKNRGVIVILNEVKPLLSEYIPYASLSLQIEFDPIFVPQLLLMVRVPRDIYFNGFEDKMSIVDSLIDPLVMHLNLHKEFFIYDESIWTTKTLLKHH